MASEDERPREQITWFEARDFCESRGERLPTEAEWEYAARGPEAWIYPWGDEFDGSKMIWNRGLSDGTAPVGSLPAGASWVGALDMSGNAWEWVSSIYQRYPYDSSDGRESSQDTNSARVLRGGSWNLVNAVYLRAAYRYDGYPYGWLSNFGFRCARSR
jgi:iron(II)-dependent oxidoreductase